MANDRLYLVCRSCLQAITLWKHFPLSGGYAVEDVLEAAQGRLGRFIAHHLDEHELRYAMRFGPEAPFYVATESTRPEITMWIDEDAVRES